MSEAKRHLFEHPDFVIDYIDGLLPDDERLRAEAHLEACPNCRSIVDDQVHVATALRAARDSEPPRELEQHIFAEITRAAGAPEPADSVPGPPEDVGAPVPDRSQDRDGLRNAIGRWVERNRLRPQVLVPLAMTLLLAAIGVGLMSNSLLLQSEQDAETAKAPAEASDTAGDLAAENAPSDAGSGSGSGESTRAAADEHAGANADDSARPDTETADGSGTNPDVSEGPTAQESPEAGTDRVEGGTNRVEDASGAGTKVVTLTYDSVPAGTSPTLQALLGIRADAGTAPAGGPPAVPETFDSTGYALWVGESDLEDVLTAVRSTGLDVTAVFTRLEDLSPTAQAAASGAPLYIREADGTVWLETDEPPANDTIPPGRTLVILRSGG